MRRLHRWRRGIVGAVRRRVGGRNRFANCALTAGLCCSVRRVACAETCPGTTAELFKESHYPKQATSSDPAARLKLVALEEERGIMSKDQKVGEEKNKAFPGQKNGKCRATLW